MHAALLASGALGAVGAAQTVRVVDATGGAGSGYTTIGAAVTAASDGDVVLVRAGTYSESIVLDGKGLVVQAEVRAAVRVKQIVVRNLPAGRVATLRGIDLSTCFRDAIDLDDNRGNVWIEDCEPDSIFFTSVTASITDSDGVVLRRVDLDAGQGIFGQFSGAAVLRSTVALYECDVVGPDLVADGGPALTVSSSLVTIYGSSLLGGTGGGALGGGAGGCGLSVHGSSVVDVFASQIQAGPMNSQHICVSAGVVNQFPGASAHWISGPRTLRTGRTPSYTLHGDPGDLAYVVLGAGPVPAANVSHPRAVGPLVLGAPQKCFFFGVVPATGRLATSVPISPISGEALSFYMQSLFLAPGSHGIALGAPTHVLVLDSSF